MIGWSKHKDASGFIKLSSALKYRLKYKPDFFSACSQSSSLVPLGRGSVPGELPSNLVNYIFHSNHLAEGFSHEISASFVNYKLSRAFKEYGPLI